MRDLAIYLATFQALRMRLSLLVTLYFAGNISYSRVKTQEVFLCIILIDLFLSHSRILSHNYCI